MGGDGIGGVGGGGADGRGDGFVEDERHRCAGGQCRSHGFPSAYPPQQDGDGYPRQASKVVKRHAGRGGLSVVEFDAQHAGGQVSDGQLGRRARPGSFLASAIGRGLQRIAVAGELLHHLGRGVAGRGGDDSVGDHVLDAHREPSSGGLWAQAAQHDRREMSPVKVWAASLSASAMVKYGAQLLAIRSTVQPASNA